MSARPADRSASSLMSACEMAGAHTSTAVSTENLFLFRNAVLVTAFLTRALTSRSTS
jgi:hypothetical protein